VSDDEAIRMAMVPMSFISPWSYSEDCTTGLDEAADIELVEEQDDGEDDDDDAL
jgi:hypothetical protein